MRESNRLAKAIDGIRWQPLSGGTALPSAISSRAVPAERGLSAAGIPTSSPADRNNNVRRGTSDARETARFVGQANGRRSTERDEYVVAQRRAGYTLQEIADDLGVSRERVRQLCERAGIADLHAAGGPERLDPIAVLRYARSPECRSLKAAAVHLGVPVSSVYAMVHQLGAMGALKRLYRWRASSAQRASIIARVGAWIDANGRLPTGREINDPTRTGLPCAPTIAKAFGSVSAMWRAMGVTPRRPGYRGHIALAAPGSGATP